MKRKLLGTAALYVCILAATVFTARTSAQGGDSRIQRGFELAPVPLEMKGLNPALVGLGSYIVNAQGGCNDCHTDPSYAAGGDPFSGAAEVVNAERYLAGGRAFLPSPFVSRNLTPRASNGRPAGLTLEQFIEVMRHGTDFKNGPPTTCLSSRSCRGPCTARCPTVSCRPFTSTSRPFLAFPRDQCRRAATALKQQLTFAIFLRCASLARPHGYDGWRTPVNPSCRLRRSPVARSCSAARKTPRRREPRRAGRAARPAGPHARTRPAARVTG